MTGRPAQIEAIRRRLARCETVEQLREELLAAAPGFHRALRRRTMVGNRPDLGLRVVLLEMPYTGLAGLSKDADALVALSSEASSPVRRQTLAHECAHGLLRDVERRRLELDREEEDRLCTLFARRALMPPERFRGYLRANGFPADADALHALCGEFQVSLRTAIAALNELPDEAGSVVLIAATYRGHEMRPGEKEFRVDASASARDLFVPRDRRLTSMGLRGICWWARRAQIGDRHSGREEHVILRSRRSTMRTWHGAATWSARLYRAATEHYDPDARSLVVAIDRSKMRPMPIDPTQKYSPLPRRDAPTGQTSLVS